MKKHNIVAWLGGVALVAASAFTGVTAYASVVVECVPSEGIAAYDETIIDSAAYNEVVIDSEAHWQRYSAKGSWKEDFAPDFPGDIWVANVQGDPHGIGVAGAYSVSNENSGNVDWFYLEWVPEVSHIVHHDEVSHVVHHDAVPPVICDPDYPGDDVSYGDWVDGDYDCDDTTVEQTRTKSVTSYTLVDHEWVAGTPVVTEETQSRDLTEAELANLAYLCTVPESDVVETEWVDGKYACGDTTVEQTRTVTTKEYELVEGTWVVEAEANWDVDEQTQDRALTGAEIAALVCPEKLAYTGVAAGPLGLAGAILLLAGILTPIVRRRLAL